MKKDNLHGVVSGWAIIEPLTGRFFRGFYGEPGKLNITSSPDDAYLANTRKEAVEIAKHLGKGRTMTVAKMSISVDINYQGATEVTGEDASIF